METEQFHWRQIHKIKKSQQELAPDKMSYKDIPADAKTILPKEGAMEIRFSCTRENVCAIAHLYMARRDDDIVNVATAYLKSGLQQTVRDGNACYYADYIRPAANWLRPVEAISPGLNQMARLTIDTCGYNKFFARISYFDDCMWYVDTAAFN